jgi:peroxiredoxin
VWGRLLSVLVPFACGRFADRTGIPNVTNASLQYRKFRGVE